MSSISIPDLWYDLWADLQQPGFLWQIAAVLACVVIGWAIARALRMKFAGHDGHSDVVQLSVESFAKVLPSLLILVLIVIARVALSKWHHVSLLRLAIPLAASFALIRLTFYMLHRIFAHDGQVGSFIATFERSFAILVWGGFALHIAGLWPDIAHLLQETVIATGRYQVSLLTIFQAILSVGITLMLALWMGALLEERVMRLDAVHSSLRAVMARMGRAVLVLIAILVSLSLVGIDLTVLSVFGGALGVGIGLGLQRIASNYVSGFVILLERSLSVGDVVEADKYWGTVTKINARYTVVRGFDGVESVVPNDMLILSAVQNYSLSDRSLRLMTHVVVEYQHEVETVLGLLETAAASVPRVLRNPPPEAMLAKFGGDGFELDLAFWISDPENEKMTVISNVNRAIWQTLKENEVTIHGL